MSWADIEDRVTNRAISLFKTTAIYDGSTPVDGVFDNAFLESTIGEDVGIETNQPTFFCQLSDVIGLEHGKQFVINSVCYTTVGVEPDGEGAVLVRLEAA